MAKKLEATDFVHQRKLLPIYPARDALIKEIKSNINCVVVGETGSGKTTQIPQVPCAARWGNTYLSSYVAYLCRGEDYRRKILRKFDDSASIFQEKNMRRGK